MSVKLNYDQLKESVGELVCNVDYDIYKDIFVCPEDECAEEQASALIATFCAILEELGFEFEVEDFF